MCNPSVNSTTTQNPLDHQQAQPHLYLDLYLSLPEEDVHDPPKLASKQQEVAPISVSDIVKETRALFNLAFPMLITGLILYSRSIISMLFLGRLGELELAAGSLAIAFANITGYSVLSGLALGMEPICSQAFGARRFKILSITLHRCVIFLLVCSIPISFLWYNISSILLYLKQDGRITSMAHTYLMYSLPDLFTNSLIHPIRIYLRAQGITDPLTLASLFGACLHLPLNFYLVVKLQHGLAGVASASATSNLSVLGFLVVYVFWWKGLHLPTWTAPSLRECFTGWAPLMRLAVPSCVSVCLEWWWYEIMIVFCGLLVDPKATVASMGVLIQTTSLIYVFPSSLGLAVSTRVGNELGANRPVKAKLSSVVAVGAAFVMGLSAAFFAYAMRGAWGRMFTNDAQIVRLTSLALPILGLCELGNCPQTVACGVLRGSARPCTAASVNLGAFYLLGMPVAVGLGFWVGVGFNGLWIGLLSAQICCAGLMLYAVGTTDWDLQASRSQALSCAGCEVILSPPSSTSCDSKGEEVQPLIIVTVPNSR